MKPKITLRLLAFFALALLLFALVSSLLFRSLISRSVTQAKKQEMLSRAQTMVDGLSEAIGGSGRAGMGMGGPGGQGSSLQASVRVLSQTQPNVWVLDEQLQVLSGGRMMGRSFSYDSLPPEAGELVRQVFEGQRPFSEGFSDLVGYPTLTVGVPIHQEGRVVGALLLYDAVAGIDAAAQEAQRMLLYAGAVALLLSIALALFLSSSFTRPIRRIRQTALSLAEGDYAARTQVSQPDEIGELASAVDELSLRLMQAREQGEQEEQRRQDFLASVAHELRTPVTVLRGSLEALSEGVVTEPDKVHDYHLQMLGETRGLQRLVNDLMELARLQIDAFSIEQAPLMLQDVALDALKSAERLAQAKQISIERFISPQPQPFTGDYARLRQMLLIGLDNAVKFSPAGSRVWLSLKPGQITIRDEGPGIPAEELAQVFERFRTARQSDNRQGSGLGLAIARQIAQRHGIRIELTSPQGGGAQLRFTWPEQTYQEERDQ